MSIRSIVATLVNGSLIAALAGCSGLPVRTDVNPSLSVATCRSYAFADEHVANADQPSAFGNPLNGDRLRQAIQANLAAKGIQQVADRRAADCVVGYAMGTRQVLDDFYGGFGGFRGGLGYGWGGWGGWGGYGGFGYDEPFVRNETRVSVDLFDAKTRVPIWHASVSQSIGDLRGPAAVEKINAAANAIFAKYPMPNSPVSAAPPTGPRAAT
ncbi:MAG: DUF4136 domain-containing protein [Pseudomonadota bacterium]|nr:DUF4136 domain-containing protein [Pseudomonadota bacterium]